MRIAAIASFVLAGGFSLVGVVAMVLANGCELDGNTYSSLRAGKYMVGMSLAQRGDDYTNAPHLLVRPGFWEDHSDDSWRKRYFVRKFWRLPICQRDNTDLTIFYAYSHKPQSLAATHNR